MTRFRLYPDGRVVETATGTCLGYVEHSSAYFPLDADRAPIAGPSMIEDLAALRVIRHAGRGEATLLDVEVSD